MLRVGILGTPNPRLETFSLHVTSLTIMRGLGYPQPLYKGPDTDHVVVLVGFPNPVVRERRWVRGTSGMPGGSPA